MDAVTTIIVNPRDRYSGLEECVDEVYRSTPEPFHLWVLDLGYPRAIIESVRAKLMGRDNARIVDLGLATPMDALRAVRDDIRTPTVVLLDNDSRVTPGWLPPLVAAVREGAAIVSPLILEREGLDRGAPLRNHLSTAELRVVDVEGTPYLIEQKHHRRADLDELPKGRMPTGTFELHCVMFSTATFKAIELPSMVIREHLDISMQVRARGEAIMVEPKSVVTFDNLATRMSLADMRYFFHRWSRQLTEASSRLFERRWGYRFYSEQSMYNWVFRRKTFLIARWFGLPNGVANPLTNVAKKAFCRDWDPLPDPDGASRGLYETGVPPQLSHEIGGPTPAPRNVDRRVAA
ncbi:MAG TPA: glycosyltransferase [Rhodanobacteraceae bacterium]|nr:glycosyltransferase [Rhodanobacteraceae bacterium]